jgi:putative transposase
LPASADSRRTLIDRHHDALSIRRQCELLDLPRSTFYYLPATESEKNLHLMRLLDEQYLKTPFWGSRNMTTWLRQQGLRINRKRVQRLMRLMGLEGLAPRPTTTKPAPGHRVFPYLLRNVAITHADHVWSTDIMYIPMRHGYLYLTAVLDWYSRYHLGNYDPHIVPDAYSTKGLKK